MSPSITGNKRQATPCTLRQRRLQAVVAGLVTVAEVVDDSEVRKLGSKGPVSIVFAMLASDFSDGLVGNLVDVVNAVKLNSSCADITYLHRGITSQFLLDVEIPSCDVRRSQILIDAQYITGRRAAIHVGAKDWADCVPRRSCYICRGGDNRAGLRGAHGPGWNNGEASGGGVVHTVLPDEN